MPLPKRLHVVLADGHLLYVCCWCRFAAQEQISLGDADDYPDTEAPVSCEAVVKQFERSFLPYVPRHDRNVVAQQVFKTRSMLFGMESDDEREQASAASFLRMKGMLALHALDSIWAAFVCQCTRLLLYY